MVTALLAVTIIAIALVSGYLVWNLMRKNRVLGDFIVQSYIKARSTYEEMKHIDASRAFQTDDEVGAIFNALASSLEEYLEFMTRYLEEVDEEEVSAAVRNE